MRCESGEFQLLPAVDVAGGRAAQVVQGDDDPRAAAHRWVAQGADWVHLVDLDRAFGRGQNGTLLSAIIRDLSVPVQLSGGIRDQAGLDAALETDARRVVLSCAALADLDWVSRLLAEHGDRIAVGVDVDRGELVARGTSQRWGPIARALPGIAALQADCYVVADASRDGARSGVDTALFTGVATALGGHVVASGGVASSADLVSLAAIPGVTGAVLGASLYSGDVDLRQARHALQRQALS